MTAVAGVASTSSEALALQVCGGGTSITRLMQVYAAGGEESEMKPGIWGNIVGKVLVCFLLLAGVIAISAVAGHAEERNYSVATLGTSASPLSDTAKSATYNKLRKNQMVAKQCSGLRGSINCDEICCVAAEGYPFCCQSGFQCGPRGCR
jgi:hypothetical protein